MFRKKVEPRVYVAEDRDGERIEEQDIVRYVGHREELRGIDAKVLQILNGQVELSFDHGAYGFFHSVHVLVGPNRVRDANEKPLHLGDLVKWNGLVGVLSRVSAHPDRPAPMVWIKDLPYGVQADKVRRMS